MRRRLLAIAAATLGAVELVLSVEGCSVLVSFDDVDPAVEAGAGRESGGAVGRDARADDGDDDGFRDATPPNGDVDAGLPVGVPPCDTTLLDAISCKDVPRANCAKNDNVFPSYPADRTKDLVSCNKADRPTCVRHCPNGCAIMPDGFNDECDVCAGKGDGWYCGRDLPLVHPENADLAFECENGHAREVRRSQCPDTACGAENCGTDHCASQCPSGRLKPACCI
jgi:hypothetical protein